MEYAFFSLNISCQFWDFNYLKALQRESQAFGANREKSVVSQKCFILIKTKELPKSVELSEAAADRCDWYILLDYWSEANGS